jgi:tRNA pseudouridine38-40 synthase
LADDVAVRELRVAPPGFHSRFSAVSREYRYTIFNGDVRSPLASRQACHIEQHLDEHAMNRACQCLIGQHDFMPFGWAPQGDNTVRNVLRAGVLRTGDQVVFEVVADAFLRRMVRRLVGNLILVGLGRLSEDGFRDLMSLRNRRTPAVDAPPQGLCLVRVNY